MRIKDGTTEIKSVEYTNEQRRAKSEKKKTKRKEKRKSIMERCLFDTNKLRCDKSLAREIER